MGSDDDLELFELEEKELELQLKLLKIKKARLQKERQRTPKIGTTIENTQTQQADSTPFETQSANTLSPVVSRGSRRASRPESEQEDLAIPETPEAQPKSNRSSTASIHDRVLECGHNSRERRTPKSPRSPTSPRSPIPTATVQWDFAARSATELTISAGSKIEVINYHALQG